MAKINRQQVLREQILNRPERYPNYHEDLAALLSDAMTSVREDRTVVERRKSLTEGIRAKATRGATVGEGE